MAQQALTQGQAFVTILYDGLLGRTPSPSEVQSWTALINAGTPETTIAQSFLSSAEYQNINNTQFVTSLYQGFFNRTPGSSETAGWKAALANGTSRAQIVANFDQSAEARHDFASQIAGEDQNSAFVTILYKGLLGRAPTSTEVQGWANALNSGQSKTTIAQDFLNTREYENVSDNQFVQSLYHGILGRTASPADAMGWTTSLLIGSSRAQALAGFGISAEAGQHWGISVVPTS